MKRRLTNGQLRELRAVAARAFEAEAAQRAANAALVTNRQYLSRLRQQGRELDQRRQNLQWESAATRLAEEPKLVAEYEELASRIGLATSEIAEMEPRVRQATAISAPLRAIVERVLDHVGMNRTELGIAFERDNQQVVSLLPFGTPAAAT